MEKKKEFTRPSFDEATRVWKNLLDQRGLPADCLWIFDENLCFEPDASAGGGFKLGYQTAITPPPPQAEQSAYEEFADTGARLVFYRIGSSHGKSVCLVLCDDWFETKGEADGFIRRDDWLISFRPGAAGEVPEITDKERWKKRILRNRPLHDLDFCMTLQAIYELMAHGRVLTAYERYGLKLLGAWKRLRGQAD